jgi:hypothetical protein
MTRAGPRVRGRTAYRDAAAKLAAQLLERRGVESGVERNRQYWYERRKQEEAEAAAEWDREEEARRRGR